MSVPLPNFPASVPPSGPPSVGILTFNQYSILIEWMRGTAAAVLGTYVVQAPDRRQG